MPKARHEILIVDDDPEIRHLLRTFLEREGFAVSEAADAAAARTRLAAGGVDLVTLDISLGDEDGFSLVRDVRTHNDVPIIMVSGKGDTIDRVVGLELGADDYIAKPFNLREVLARVRAVLRRHEPSRANAPFAEGDAPHERVEFGDWVFDLTSRELKNKSGETRELTTGEFNLLQLFVHRPHRVLTRDDIMDLLKGHDWSPLDRSIDALVGRLRKKVEPDVARPSHIKTVRGAGYMFASDARKV